MLNVFIHFLVGFFLTNPTFHVAAQIISVKQKGIGEPCSNRAIWSRIALDNSDIDIAKYKNNTPMLPWSNSTYFEYKTTGINTKNDYMLETRLNYVKEMVLVECVWYNGSFLAKIEEYLDSLINQPSWTTPPNDLDFSYVHGRYFVDIVSAGIAMHLGQIYYLLQDKLSDGLKKSLITSLEERTFKPMRLSSQNDPWMKAKHYWETTNNNWNTVCWSGVVIAALTTLSNETERSWFVQNAFEGSKYFLDSFNPDGYYSEGVLYFNYAINNFILLRQIVMEATDGQKDLFLIKPNLPQYLGYAVEYPMYGLVTAQFSDDSSGTMSVGIACYIKSTFSVEPTPNYSGCYVITNLLGIVLRNNLMLNRANRYPFANRTEYAIGLRKYYNHSKILVVRPVSGDGLYATFKLLGGNLDPRGGHNHDDAGSYQIVLKGVRVAGDIGGVPYSGAWYNRYSGWTYNSFAHPVPVVCDKLQVRNWIYNLQDPKPFVVNYTTSESVDTIVFDLKAAYDCSALTSLLRTNQYTRTLGNQSVVIRDDAFYTYPQPFEASVTSRGVWSETSRSTNQLTGTFTVQNVTVKVKVITSSTLSVNLTQANANGVSYTRLGVVLPVSLSHFVTVTYT